MKEVGGLVLGGSPGASSAALTAEETRAKAAEATKMAASAAGAAGETGKVLAADDPMVTSVLNPKHFGAKGDGTTMTDAAMTKGSAALESAHVFTAADVGKPIEVEAAGPGSGLPLVTTIASVAAGKATLTRAAESTVAAKGAIFASDDTVAMQATIDQANLTFLLTGTRQVVRVPSGSYLLSYAAGTRQSTQECCLILKSGVVLEGRAYLFTMAPVATIVTEEFTTPLTATAIKVASTEGFSETNKSLTLSLPNFGNIGPSWTAKTATGFTITQTGAHTVPVGTIVCQNRNRCMIATPKESIAEKFRMRELILDGRTVSAVAGGFPEENQHAVEVWGAKAFEFDGVEIKRFAGKGLFLEGAAETLSAFTVHDCDIHHLYANAMRISPSAADFVVRDNYFHDSAREELGGVETIIMSTTLNVKRGEIVNNRLINWGVMDITGTQMTVTGNTIRPSIAAVPGIRIMTLDSSLVTGNTVDMSQVSAEGAQAIINEGTVTNSNVFGNTFVGANGAIPIVQLQFTLEGVKFIDNSVTATVENQGVVYGSATAKNCTMAGNTIALKGGTATVNMISGEGGKYIGNTVTGAKSTIQGKVIANNHLSPKEGKGAEALRVLMAGASITGNTLVGANGNSGVLRLSNAAKHCTVVGNNIETTEANAAWIAEESECDWNLVEGNHLSSSTTGSTIILAGPNSRQRNNHGTNGTDTFPRRAVAANVTLKNTDDLLAVTSTSAERTITLPEAAKCPKGTRYTIKDESLGAATHNIKVVPKTPASEKIDGAESSVISTNGGKVVLYTDQTNWFTV
jgi:Right handed beta helix region